MMYAALGGSTSGTAPTVITANVWDELADKLYHTAILHGWSREFLGELKAALKGTSITTQQRWVEMMRSRMAGVRGIKGCGSCSHEVPLNLVLDDSAESACASCSAETFGPINMLANPSLRRIRASQTIGLPPGHSCATAMFESFDLLCRTAVQISVVDRFAVTDAIRQDTRSSLSSGLQKLMIMADDGGVSEIHIYTAEGGQIQNQSYNGGMLATDLALILPGLQLKSLVVYLHVVPLVVGRREVHDRWLGFSWPPAGLVSVALGKGLSQFDDTTTRQHFVLSRQDDSTVSQLVGRLAPQAILNIRVN